MLAYGVERGLGGRRAPRPDRRVRSTARAVPTIGKPAPDCRVRPPRPVRATSPAMRRRRPVRRRDIEDVDGTCESDAERTSGDIERGGRARVHPAASGRPRRRWLPPSGSAARTMHPGPRTARGSRTLHSRRGTIGAHADVAEFAGKAVRAAYQRPVHHQPGADADFTGHIEEAVRPISGCGAYGGQFG